MTSRDLDRPRRVLAIGAHPDDIEFRCGATLAKWAAGGAHCEMLVLTDGSKGSWDPTADTTALVATREHEQRNAAAALGVATVHFAGFVDGELEASRAGRERVCATIREARPEVVLGHDPWKRYRLHPDHRVAGDLLIEGVVAARDPHFFPGLGEPHRPTTMLLFEAEEVDHVESIDPGSADAKVAALLAHRSQWHSTMGIDPHASDDARGRQHDAFVARILDQLRNDDADDALCERFKRIDDL
jgi:LmbE family N-acetylglucosaminyl deacetylase